MTAKLSMLRFYIATRPKEVEDDASETSDVILVSSHSSNETSTAQLQVRDAAVDFDVQSSLEMSVDAEITFGPLHDVVEDTGDTLISESFLIPTSPPNPEDVITIVIHHANTLHDMITAFSDAELLNKAVNVKRILPKTLKRQEVDPGSRVMFSADSGLNTTSDAHFVQQLKCPSFGMIFLLKHGRQLVESF